MSWMNEADFRLLYVTESATETKSAQILQSLNAGRRVIASVVGDGTVAAVAADTSVPPAFQTLDLREAQGKLALRELLIIQTTRVRDGGIVQAERDANNATINQYATFTETEKRRAALLGEAMAIIEFYAPAPFATEMYGQDSGFAVGASTVNQLAADVFDSRFVFDGDRCLS